MTGAFPPGERLPSVRDLAQKHVARFMEAMRSLAISREETLSLLEAEFGKETGTNECPDM